MGLEHLALGLGIGTYLDNKRTEKLRREYPDKNIPESYYWRNYLQFP